MIILSASPSKEIPICARYFFTAFLILFGKVEPQFLFILRPLGFTPIEKTVAPKDLNNSGPALYPAPFAKSFTILSPLRLKDFVNFSIEDYENCTAMWNLKNQSYIVMSEEVPNSIVINVEDFHSNQLAFHTNLASLLDKKDVPLTEMNNYVNGRGRHEDKDISSSLKIPQLDDDLLEIINGSLSEQIMERCNYKILK